MNLPLDAQDRVIPLRGQLFIEREDPHMVSSAGLIIPDGVRASYRPSNAVVRRVSPEVTEFREGDRLLLAAGIGRKIHFGDRQEVTWESISPGMVMAVIEGVEVGKPRSHPLRGIMPTDTVVDEDLAQVDEGDDRGVV